ncbi:MAG: peptide-binding protein [Nitrospirales bacterium]|nr:MAG: peptide-binding protein [Nitrospirales bacterium]
MALHSAIVLTILTLTVGCSEPRSDTTLRFGLANTPANLDPRFATDATSARVNRLLYSRLIDFDEAARPVPSLATWEQISPVHYRFFLQPTRQPFHHGAELTASDVKATYDFVLDASNHSPHRSALTLISDIHVPTDNIVDFYLNKPDRLFPSYLVIGILPANLIRTNHPFHEHPIGNGAFTFIDRPDDTHWRLMRQVDRQYVELLRIPDPTVRVLKLLAGEIDMIQNDLPPELTAYLDTDDKISIQRRQGANFSYLGFNLQDPVVGQHRIREAIAHAIDRTSIIHHLLHDTAHPANAMFPPKHWVGDATLSGYDYNPTRARALLRQAGFDEAHPVRLTYKTSTDPIRLRVATIVQDQLAHVGIDVSIQSHDWGTFYGDIKAGRFQMYSLSWVGLKTPDIFRYVFHSSSIPPRGANRGRFIDTQSDRLIEQAQATQDLHRKSEIYRRLQAHLLHVLPYVPLWFEEHVFLARRNITGYVLSADGNYDGLLTVTRRPTSTQLTRQESHQP